jgi:hypothetical protein
MATRGTIGARREITIRSLASREAMFRIPITTGTGFIIHTERQIQGSPTLKRLLTLLATGCVAIVGAESVVAQLQVKPNVFGTGNFSIFIDGKTKSIGMWTIFNPDWVIKNKGIFDAYHPPTDGNGARALGRGKCTLPPNSSIQAFRNTSLDFATGILFDYERSRKRNFKLALKSDELRKDGTYVAVIEQISLGFHQ